MKKIIFILVILHFSILASNAQWIIQRPAVTSGQSLYDVEFINRNTGWACGDGLILKTTDGGNNWLAQNHPAFDKPLLGIHPVNENVIYCVGYFETILKTTNGGNNWIALRNNPGNEGPSELAVFFIDENTGWVTRQDGGGYYNVLKTTNGGSTFDSMHVFYSYLNDIYFKDSNTGLICGDGAKILKTTNGGNNWISVHIPNNFVLGNFIRISVVENKYCWTITSGENKVYHSTDFGNTWDSLSYVYSQHEAYCIRFSSQMTGWVGGAFGMRYKTINGGLNWYRDTVNMTSPFIGSYWFYNDSIGWAVGGRGQILFTQTGGTITTINSATSSISENFLLYQNYPNPFNNETKIRFHILAKEKYSLVIYNSLGQVVEELFNQEFDKGTYTINYKTERLSSGVYYYKLSSRNNSIVKSFILIK